MNTNLIAQRARDLAKIKDRINGVFEKKLIHNGAPHTLYIFYGTYYDVINIFWDDLKVFEHDIDTVLLYAPGEWEQVLFNIKG